MIFTKESGRVWLDTRESVYVSTDKAGSIKVNPGIEHDILQGGNKGMNVQVIFKKSRFDWDIARLNVSRIHHN